MNLYFPDAWLRPMTSTLNRLLAVGLVESKDISYIDSVHRVDHFAYTYALGVAMTEVGHRVGVPAWVYILPKNPYMNGGK